MDPERTLPDRRAVRAALRGVGLSNRQADAFIRDGWKAVVGVVKAENEELREALTALNKLVAVETKSPSA
jgi:hypothetical protein